MKGKQHSVTIYELIEYENEHDRKMKQSTINQFEQGLKHYQNQNVTAALEFFQTLPQEPIIEIYLQMCQHTLHNPEDWSDVIFMKEK
ncbi:hypothetical protein ACFL27_15875 [candidate division CSSED10-310 bacterium]|uniref:Uncharacterized protein n=1 Tax=candidate division CSSED10-310 bacterium TaxID=2855610 RepID=A0ABV6YZR0_UNCC1